MSYWGRKWMWGKPRRVRRAQVSKEQVGEDNTKSQYWRKDRGEKEGDREERVTEREPRELCLFSWLERFNQVHIVRWTTKARHLSEGSQRGAREQAEPSLFRPLSLGRRGKIRNPKQSRHFLSRPSCVDLYLLVTKENSQSCLKLRVSISLIFSFISLDEKLFIYIYGFKNFHGTAEALFAPDDKDLLFSWNHQHYYVNSFHFQLQEAPVNSLYVSAWHQAGDTWC